MVIRLFVLLCILLDSSKYYLISTAINNTIVINKKASKI